MNEQVTIIMGIYNCEDTLAEALDSLLAQTFTGWKLIMCDDGSSDHTRDVALAYVKKYKQMKLITNKENKGLNATLNRCLKQADTKYTARMDGDDRSLPDRLQKEYDFLENHPEYALVSTEMRYFDETGIWGCSSSKEEPVPLDFMYGTPFCHAPSMVRTKVMREVGGYTVKKRFLRVEDYHLWMKIYRRGYRGFNLKEPLYEMRDDRNARNRRKLKYRWNESYVRLLAVRMFHLPKRYMLMALRSILVGLLPDGIYRILHKKRLQKAGR